MAIEISDKAVDEVRRMMHKEGVQAAGLRVGVKGGGCSGLSYNLSFETQPRTGDKVFEREDVKLFCDLKSYIYLNGTVLDNDSGLMGKGFVFMNPNAKKSCGCGSSFSTYTLPPSFNMDYFEVFGLPRLLAVETAALEK